MKEIVKICKIHGELTLQQTRQDSGKFRCKQCRIKSNKKSYYVNREKRIKYSVSWKEKNREHVNLWHKEDRKKYPEKYKLYAQTHRGKHGVIRNIREIARTFGLTVQQYQQLIKDQDNKCAICKQNETRKNRSGNISALAVDHCHKFEKETGKIMVRGLLCHGCNSGLGHFKEDIQRMQKAIDYLKSHQ